MVEGPGRDEDQDNEIDGLTDGNKHTEIIYYYGQRHFPARKCTNIKKLKNNA